MSNVPVMPLGGGGGALEEIFKFWDDAIAPVQWEEVPAEVEMNSSGFPTERIMVHLDESFFPDTEYKRFIVLVLVGEQTIYENAAVYLNSRSRLYLAGAQVYWQFKSNGEINSVSAEPLMYNSGAKENQGCAVCVEVSPHPGISSKRSATGVKPSYNMTSHILYLPFDAHSYTSTSGICVEIPLLRALLIRIKQ